MRSCPLCFTLACFALVSSSDGFSTTPRKATSVPVTTTVADVKLVDRRGAISSAVVGTFVGLSLIKPEPVFASYIDPTVDPPTITKRVYFDVQIGEASPERITMSLYGDLMPKTVENFVQLCDNNGYAGTTFYRVLSDYNIQGGAIGDPTGKTGKSSATDGSPIEPDNFDLKHTKAGLVSMVRSTPAGGIDSRFFIQLLDDGGWADDRYAAFGTVDGDLKVVRKIEKVNVKRPSNAPAIDVKIIGSGIL